MTSNLDHFHCYYFAVSEWATRTQDLHRCQPAHFIFPITASITKKTNDNHVLIVEQYDASTKQFTIADYKYQRALLL
ncbi:UNVERIFIED_CONTAM: hypothetical protein ABIC26_004812 [Paenibacillus sp. PvR008]